MNGRAPASMVERPRRSRALREHGKGRVWQPAPRRLDAYEIILVDASAGNAAAVVTRWRRDRVGASLHYSPVQPTCPQCSESMELARTAPFRVHNEIEDRTYKFPKCGYSESWVVTQINLGHRSVQS
jgi:predicted RNA-binding Zn-ribbon protein involved in translation (DUF1610 family)